MEKLIKHLEEIENTSVYHKHFISKLRHSIQEGSVESIVADIMYSYPISDIEKAFAVILEYVKEK